MAVRKINESTLMDIADAIRSKTGGSALINPEDMASEIESIKTSGGSGGIIHSQSTFSPEAVYGRTSNGGFPALVSFIASVVPSDVLFFCVTCNDSISSLSAYSLISMTGVYTDTSEQTGNRISTGNVERVGSNGSKQYLSTSSRNPSYSCIINPNSTYTLDVWKNDTGVI